MFIHAVTVIAHEQPFTSCLSVFVGFTLAALLHSDGHGTGKLTLGADATTVICHRYTPPEELRRLASGADIVISATGHTHLSLSLSLSCLPGFSAICPQFSGVRGLIKADMIKDGATVIDVGEFPLV